MKNRSLQPFLHKDLIEAGCDEAGRGCLAGPVYAAAVILEKKFNHHLLNDSKKLTEKNRYIIREFIEKEAVAYSIAFVSNTKIDEINILNASILAMHLALKDLSVKPQHILVDGHRFKSFHNIPFTCIVKGDSTYASIAAASVLAKTYRDDYMKKIDNVNPEYHWKKNKGYATKDHRDAIIAFGSSKYHRRTFRVKHQQFKLAL
ncbi:ribonuclease HII [Bacteroidota bacterium]